VHTCTCTHRKHYIRAYMHMHTPETLYTCMYAHLKQYVRACMHMHTSDPIYTCMYAHAHIWHIIHVHICTYTHLTLVPLRMTKTKHSWQNILCHIIIHTMSHHHTYYVTSSKQNTVDRPLGTASLITTPPPLIRPEPPSCVLDFVRALCRHSMYDDVT